jgi:RimJ/RimL family protein N-acetyltransferase
MATNKIDDRFDFTFSPLASQDLEFFNLVRNSSAPYLHDARVFTLEETKDWFKGLQDHKYWVIRVSGQSIGYFRARVLKPNKWEIGADLQENFRGQGLAPHAYRAFAKKVLLPAGVETCTLKVLKTNVRAYALYQKLGFQTLMSSGSDIKMAIQTSSLIVSPGI